MSANSDRAIGCDDNYATEIVSEDSFQSESEADSEAEPNPLQALWKSLRTSMSTSMFERTETKMFLPRDTFEQILSRTAEGLSGRRKLVLEVMGIESSRPSEDDRALANYILDSAQKVFLIAVYIQLEQLHAAMKLFQVSRYKDEKLPVEECTAQQLQDTPKCHQFVRMETVQRNRKRKEGEKNPVRIWDIHTISEFQDNQWIFLAPTISARDLNRKFDHRCPIPFITKDSQLGSGAHGVVHKYTIHPAHFWDSLHQYGTEPYVVAVKAFRKGGKNVAGDVKREVNALAKMNQLRQEHIVRFITSFQRGTQEDLVHHVLFEWADGGNLSDFWKQAHKRERTAPLVKWVVKQVYGLAKALSAVHHMPDGVSYSHGDLKPGNILWFPDSGGYGTLKIGDWGAAKIHDQDFAFLYGRLKTTAKYGTRRYEAPEIGLQSLLPKGTPHVRSRLYDVWSMGCIILEFIIWLLYDHEELRRFNNNNLGHFGPSDMFYEISHERVVRIHRVAEHWMEHMAKDGLCRAGETALGDLLHVVRTGLLVVELPKDDDSDFQAAIGLDFITHGSTSKQRTRFRANELETELLRIAQGGESEHYWSKIQKPRLMPEDIVGSSQSLGPTGRTSHPAGLPIPNGIIDYSHPSLDPEDWEFKVDNDFATTLSSRLGSITGISPHQTPSSARLCAWCRDFEERVLDADFAIIYATQTLRTNTKAETCNMCCMLWRSCCDIAEGWSKGRQTCRDMVEGKCKSVSFERAGSILRMRDTKHPVLTILRSNDTGDRALDVQIGLPELPEAGTDLHLGSIRGWLNECDMMHFKPVCKPHNNTRQTEGTNTRLPTRLIHVGSDGDDVVKLREMQPGDTGDWTALSYRWGNSPPFSTTRQNLASNIMGMTLTTLPRTFQDAIKVTRALGKEYLWIDSICIIQGEDGDFNSESKRMEDVYSGAYCVLAASCATDQRSGFLLPRVKRDFVTMSSTKGGEGGKVYVCSMIEDFGGHVLQGALHKRGWVLQEHALARRTVFFTEHQTYWECGHGVRCESMMRMRNESAALLGDPEFPKILDWATFGERIMRVQDLYRQYSRLDLTSDYDRPTAIGGLQQRLLRTMHVNGGFGILDDPNTNEFLIRSLLWHRGENIRTLSPIVFPSDRERVPSWSWMSVSGGIDYFIMSWDCYDWQAIRPSWAFSSIKISNAFRGFSQVFDLTSVRANEEDVVFDNILNSDIPEATAIVLGIEKGLKEIDDKKHYILVVRPKMNLSPDSEVLYERIGAGYVPGRCLKGGFKACTLV